MHLCFWCFAGSGWICQWLKLYFTRYDRLARQRDLADLSWVYCREQSPGGLKEDISWHAHSSDCDEALHGGGGTKWSLLALEKLGLHVNHGDIIPLLLSPLSFVWVFSTHIFSSPQIDLGVTDFSWRKKPCQVVLIFHRKLQLWPLWTCWLGTTFAIRRSNTK